MPFRKLLGDKNPVGQTIVSLREAMGMDQQKLLAQMQLRGINLSQASLSRLEGQQRAVKAEELMALADIFHVPMEELCNKEIVSE